MLAEEENFAGLARINYELIGSLMSLQQRIGQNRRPLDHARVIVLAAAGGKPSDTAAVRGDGAKGRCFTGGNGLDGACAYAISMEAVGN
jgi:hypothetical protein